MLPPHMEPKKDQASGTDYISLHAKADQGCPPNLQGILHCLHGVSLPPQTRLGHEGISFYGVQ